MKLAIVFLGLLALALATTPALGEIAYSNGPYNGTVDAWTINFGYAVSDTFTWQLGHISGFDLWVWEYPYDQALTVDWSVTTEEFGGAVLGSGTANVTDTLLSTNQYGYEIHKLSAAGLAVFLGAGTYWLNLQNATTLYGNPLYWDENSGFGCTSPGCPSEASESELGTIPSESFDLTGGYTCTGCMCWADRTGCDDTPEPGGFTLLGSGIAGLAGLAGGLRHKLFR